ncbi:hypothetical protein CRG98_010738 [Punica granatum]|uniref:Uncharacterized protein n=1 Tax=Punica granatum TaxID=22663 RepID=A0A2I0KL08_PUNGR|nr:hypothetical protein CRG98_010738 [Punica granatum]
MQGIVHGTGTSRPLGAMNLFESIILSISSVSTPFWPTSSHHEDSRPKLELLFMTRQSEVNARTSIPLEPRHSRTFTDAFLTGLLGHPIHERANDGWKQAYTCPRTTKAMKQVSDCLSEFGLVSRVGLDPGKMPFLIESNAQGLFGGKLTSERCTTHSQQTLGSRKSYWLGLSGACRPPE